MASLSREAIMMENKQPCAQDDMGPINSSTVYAQYSKKKKTEWEFSMVRW